MKNTVGIYSLCTIKILLMKRETVQTPLISENEKILEAAGTG